MLKTWPGAVSIRASSVSAETLRLPSKRIDVTTGFSITRNVTATPSGRCLMIGGAWSAKNPRSAMARRSCWTAAGSNGSPTFVLTTDRMRSVGMCAFPVTETETTVGAAGRGNCRRHHQTEEREHGEHDARRATEPFEQAEDVLRTRFGPRARPPWATGGLLIWA